MKCLSPAVAEVLGCEKSVIIC